MRQVADHRGEMLTIRLYDAKEDTRSLLALYERYSAELARVGTAGFDPHDPWWEKPEQCCTIVALTPRDFAGFLMIGYSKQVDDDVASEICEAYVAPRWRGWGLLRRMFDAGAPYLREPWGFQVLTRNARTWRCAERWLRRRTVPYEVREATDDGAPVRKYRILTSE